MTTLSIDRPKFIETGVLTTVTAAVAWMLYSIPSWRDGTAGASLVAALACVGVVAFLWVSLWWAPRSPRTSPSPRTGTGTGSKPGAADGEKTYRPTPAESWLLAA